MLMKKNIVIFSNPFGYGPTGKAIAIAKEFIKIGYDNVVFAGSSFVQEILPISIKYINIDERNEQAIENLLKTIPNSVVVSSQNRFAIKVALSLKIPCAFLDGLSWFWKEIPLDHFIADEIFWMKYPGIEEKINKSNHPIHLVPAIVDTQSMKDPQEPILIHLGGCKNPLIEAFPKYYIDMLAEAIYEISDNIKITGGIDAINYLKMKFSLHKKNNISLVSLKHDEFIQELSCSKHFITTAGQTATLEAFALGIPTSFLLPMNLSQLALMNLLLKYGANTQCVMWDSYIPKEIKINEANEKEAIVGFNIYAETIKNNNKIFNHFKKDLIKIITHIPENKGQKKFIDNLGTDGAREIVNILSNKWDLV